jgi:hypothetical protein
MHAFHICCSLKNWSLILVFMSWIFTFCTYIIRYLSSFYVLGISQELTFSSILGLFVLEKNMRQTTKTLTDCLLYLQFTSAVSFRPSYTVSLSCYTNFPCFVLRALRVSFYRYLHSFWFHWSRESVLGYGVRLCCLPVLSQSLTTIWKQ